MNAPTLQKDILYICLSPSADLHIKNGDVTSLRSMLIIRSNTPKQPKTRECLTPGHFVGAQHASK